MVFSKSCNDIALSPPPKKTLSPMQRNEPKLAALSPKALSASDGRRGQSLPTHFFRLNMPRQTSSLRQLFTSPTKKIFSSITSAENMCFIRLEDLEDAERAPLTTIYSQKTDEEIETQHDNLMLIHSDLVKMYQRCIEASLLQSNQNPQSRSDQKKSAQGLLDLLNEDIDCEIALQTFPCKKDNAIDNHLITGSVIKDSTIIVSDQFMLDISRDHDKDCFTIGDKRFVTSEGDIKEFIITLMKLIQSIPPANIRASAADQLISKILTLHGQTFDAPMYGRLVKVIGKQGEISISSDTSSDERYNNVSIDSDFKIQFERTVTYTKNDPVDIEKVDQKILATRFVELDPYTAKISHIGYAFKDKV